MLLNAACAGPGLSLPAPAPIPTGTSPSATLTAGVLSPSATPTARPTPTETPTPSPTATPDHPSAGRVLVLSLDGLRPDAITFETAPNISALAARGAASWAAQSVEPSRTLPAHASMLTGYDVVTHGLSWNSYQPENGFARSPTLLGLAKASGLRTVMIVRSDWLVHIAVPGTVDVFAVAEADPSATDVARAQMYFGFGVMFIQMLGPDRAGHRSGWMSPDYLREVSEADREIGILIDLLETQGLADTTLVILTADHGGEDRGHGSEDPQEITIPWIVAGPGVAPGRTLTSTVRIYDTTATALWALGVPIPDTMDGRPVREAFTQSGG